MIAHNRDHRAKEENCHFSKTIFVPVNTVVNHSNTLLFESYTSTTMMSFRLKNFGLPGEEFSFKLSSIIFCSGDQNACFANSSLQLISRISEFRRVIFFSSAFALWSLHWLTDWLTDWPTDFLTDSGRKLEKSLNFDARTLKFGMKHPWTHSLRFRKNHLGGPCEEHVGP